MEALDAWLVSSWLAADKWWCEAQLCLTALPFPQLVSWTPWPLWVWLLMDMASGMSSAFSTRKLSAAGRYVHPVLCMHLKHLCTTVILNKISQTKALSVMVAEGVSWWTRHSSFTNCLHKIWVMLIKRSINRIIRRIIRSTERGKVREFDGPSVHSVVLVEMEL